VRENWGERTWSWCSGGDWNNLR